MRRELFNKCRVSIAGAPAKPVIQMANNEFLVAALNQPMKQRHRIAPARHGNEILPVRRKLADKVFILNPIQRNLASNIQSP